MSSRSERRGNKMKTGNKYKKLDYLRISGHNLGQRATCFAKKMRHVLVCKKVVKANSVRLTEK